MSGADARPTAGPWVAVENGFCFDVNAENQTVAFVPAGDEAATANARLIAAAPEMKAALHEARGALVRLEGKGDKYAKAGHARAMQMIDAALVRADAWVEQRAGLASQ